MIHLLKIYYILNNEDSQVRIINSTMQFFCSTDKQYYFDFQACYIDIIFQKFNFELNQLPHEAMFLTTTSRRCTILFFDAYQHVIR